MIDYLTRECGDCMHWIDRGPNPEDVSAGHMGECRESPHVIAVQVPAPPESRLIPSGAPRMQPMPRTQLVSLYAPIPATFQACSRFLQRPAQDTTNDSD